MFSLYCRRCQAFAAQGRQLMELKLCTYATVTTLGDFGPWISKVVLDLPCTVRANAIDANTFHIDV